MRWTYAIWLVLLTLLAVAGLSAWWQFMSQPPLPLPLPPASGPVTVEASYLVPGAVVFPLGVLLNCAALGLMMRKSLVRLSPAPAPRTGWQWAAALTLSAGPLVCGSGFYLMPEAVTATCPPNIFSVTPFAHGACAGIDSDHVLPVGYDAGLTPVALFFSRVSWKYELRVAAAGITTLGGWPPQLSVYTLTWLAVRPVLGLGGAFVALQGAGLVAQQRDYAVLLLALSTARGAAELSGLRLGDLAWADDQ